MNALARSRFQFGTNWACFNNFASGAIVLATGYFAYLFRAFRGKVMFETEGQGY